MSLSDKLRKAASLFVVMPESESGGSSSSSESGSAMDYGTPSASAVPTSSGAAAMSEDDLDRRLAAMNNTLRQFNTGGAVEAVEAAETTDTAGVATPAPTPPPLPEATGGVKTIDELLRETEGPSLNEIVVSSQETPPVTTADGSLDFPAIYQAASLPSTPFTAEQTLEMLNSLPANLPLDIKRMTVQATIGTMGKTIGATPETIVADASRKLAVLAAYDADMAKNTEGFVAGTESEITALLAQVEEKRTAILEARQRAAQVRQACEAEADRLDDILEFFSLDIGASKYAAPEAGVTSGQAAMPPPLPPSA